MVSMPPPDRSLHEWASLQTELIWVYDQVVAPEFLHQSTVGGRTGYWARYVRKGRVVLTGTGGRTVAGPGQWLTGAREKGTVDFTDDAHILSIHFICQWPTGDNFFVKTGGRIIEDAECPGLRKQAEVLERSVRKRQGAWVGYAHEQAAYPDFLRRQALFVNWLATWCEALVAQGCRPAYGGSGDERLTRVVRRLNESPLAAGFPKALLRAEAKLSPGQLDLKFAQTFGLSPWRYWERRRLEHAKRRLAQMEIPVKQVSYELGFKSDAHFVAWFRRLAGDAPGRFRVKPMEAR
ncbi:MAG: AraC family transcriptional regulator [Rariglobus sp.]|jgi:AraC-like DNA-binding protein|nr:AraC family transcriptional regulator [Rariglobus sp.]